MSQSLSQTFLAITRNNTDLGGCKVLWARWAKWSVPVRAASTTCWRWWT